MEVIPKKQSSSRYTKGVIKLLLYVNYIILIFEYIFYFVYQLDLKNIKYF